MIRSYPLGLPLGMCWAVIAALSLHYSVPLSLGWGMGVGAFAGIAADKSRPMGARVFYAALAAAIAVAAIWVFATHGGT